MSEAFIELADSETPYWKRVAEIRSGFCKRTHRIYSTTNILRTMLLQYNAVQYDFLCLQNC